MSDTQFAIILHKTRGTGCVADCSPHSQPVVPSPLPFSNTILLFVFAPSIDCGGDYSSSPARSPAHSAPHIHRPQIFQHTTPPPLSLSWSSSSVLWIVVGSIPPIHDVLKDSVVVTKSDNFDFGSSQLLTIKLTKTQSYSVLKPYVYHIKQK
ncbi:hypothetical protein Ddc_03477 [Ditylenchus destructor]|nr:hypothetical protein Ddc_03477 [Ditylenchus destructor]